MGELRVSQLLSEVASEGDGELRVSQLLSEVANSGIPNARVSQLVVEVATVQLLVTGAFIASAAALFAPIVNAQIVTATIGSTATVNGPSIAAPIIGVSIASGELLFPPEVEVPLVGFLAATAREEIVICEPDPTYTLIGFTAVGGGTPNAYSISLPRFVQTAYVRAGMFAKCIGVKQNDTALTQHASLAAVDANAGSWYWDEAAGVLYVRPTTGVPADYTMLATRRLFLATSPVILEQVRGDATSNVYYHPWITGQLPTVTRAVEDLLAGTTTMPSGQVEFSNGHRAWQTLVAADGLWNWKNARITFLIGGRYYGRTLRRSEYGLLTTMIVEDVAPTETVCRMALLPPQRQTDLELPITPFFESTYPNLGDGVRGTKKHIGYGRAIIKPDLTDTSGLGVYTLADAAFQTLFAVNNVWATAKSTGARTLLVETTHYTKNLTTCTVTVVSATYPHADYELEVDVTGKPDGLGSYLKTYGSIVRDMLTTFLGLTAADLDTASFDTADLEAESEIAFWIKSPRSLASILSTAEPELASLNRSVMGAVQQRVDGKWTVDIWTANLETIQTHLRREDFARFEPKPKLGTIFGTVRVFYNQNLATGAWSVVEKSDPTVRYKTGSRDALELYTFLRDEVGATSIAERYLLLAGSITVEAEFLERGALLAQFIARQKLNVTYTPAPAAAGGYTAAPFEILRLQLAAAPKLTVSGVLGNLRGLGGLVGTWMDEPAPAWASATDAERVVSGFWCDDDGFADPGDPLSRNRSVWF